MRRHLLNELCLWITEAAVQDPCLLRQHVCRRLGVSPGVAGQLLARLEAAQWLVRGGTARRPHYRPGLLRQVVRRYPLAGLQEDLPWVQDVVPHFQLPEAVAATVQHVHSELLNNAIDHSQGTQVTVSLRQTPLQVQLLVSDDGRGIFDAIGRDFGITDPTLAMVELAKGKLTSQPERHTGRGLFFAARLADVFELHANERSFQHRQWQNPLLWHPGRRPACRQGSSVYAAFSLERPRAIDEVLRGHSLDGQGYGFERTVVPLALLAPPGVQLQSRAQARRVAARLTEFRQADLDFSGVPEVGHAFADELFRVFGTRQPGLALTPVNMAPRVAALVASVTAELRSGHGAAAGPQLTRQTFSMLVPPG